MAGTELAKAYVQIIPSADGIKGKLTSALGGEAGSAGDSAGKTAGTSLGASMKKVIAAAGIGTAVVGAFKSAISEGAGLQQSLGGIETLFKDSADKVIANANKAYMTAGLSANEYMESVTSFSASLLQGLAGDTNKAADVADMALTDMSDNANKMGTSMELIQNAYQGFAKQNYTMLDNLKLGYGGTKTEMERLLADASKLSGVKYDIGNLGDVYEAIHVIQEEMGITGTTAKEAASTFSGSFASMKAAASNLLGSLALGEDIKPAMNALISSTGTFLFDNLFPMVGDILTSLVEYIVDTVVNTDWNAVIMQTLTNIKGILQSGITTHLGADTWQIMNDSATASFQGLWEVCDTVWTSIGQPLWEGIQFAIGEVQKIFAEYMPQIREFVRSAMTDIKASWESHLKPCLEAIGNFLKTVLKPAFEFVFDAIIRPLIDNAFKFIVSIWHNTLKPVFDGICDFLTGVFTGDWKKAFQGILDIVTGIFKGIKETINSYMNLAKDVVKNAIDKIKELFNFEWKLPDLKLPHFTIEGAFSLNPPSVPTLGIEWYAKAMNDPMIMNSPTAFGINSLGQIMAGGEKGSEVVSGTDTLMNMIAAAVASQNKGVIDALYALQDVLLLYLPQLANMQLVTDTGTLIGELAPGMDAELGMISNRKARGN